MAAVPRRNSTHNAKFTRSKSVDHHVLSDGYPSLIAVEVFPRPKPQAHAETK